MGDQGSYRLLDSGQGRKLEQVGPWLLDRPAPGAAWARGESAGRWNQAAGRHHRKDTGGGYWESSSDLPESWEVALGGLKLRARPTPFGHVGFFAEQTEQWAWLRKTLQEVPVADGAPPEILNLFAYTGGATLACAQAGARVCHVDAAHGIVDWARDHASLNRLAEHPIRWIVDDCARFVAREVRRNRRYAGLILDPPTFGRGANKERWILEEHLPELLRLCRELLGPTPRLILLSGHTPGFTGTTLKNLLADHFVPESFLIESGEMAIEESGSRERCLPAGAFTRWTHR